MTWPGGSLRCPVCRGTLTDQLGSLSCSECAASYPVVAGIPDLRVCPDPYISIDEDRDKAVRLTKHSSEMSFAELVDFYYQITPEVPADLASRYASHHLAGLERARGSIERAQCFFPSLTWDASLVILDLGCGTGGLLVQASRTGAAVVGVDIALRWLVIARRRLEELGILDLPLICGCADHLPLTDSSFDLVVADGLLEHVVHAGSAIREIERVSRDKRFQARTVNRFVLAPEPHVNVWGVGFLPRRWMNGFVQWRRGLPYQHVHLRSSGEWRRLLRSVPDTDATVRFPEITAADLRAQPTGRRRLLAGFARLGRIKALRPLLGYFGPFFDLVGALRNRTPISSSERR